MRPVVCAVPSTGNASSSSCVPATTWDEPDFEDGCIRATAERAQVDFLITRDQSAYARSWVKTYSARDFLSLFPSV